MKRTNICYLLLMILFIFACEEKEMTQIKVEYDENKPPVITELTQQSDSLWVESIYNWDIRIEAFNAIDTVYLNDEPLLVFTNGQLIYEQPIAIYMPDVDSLKVDLRVVDELGLSTSFPTFYLYAKGRIPSSYLLLDWNSSDFSEIKRGEDGYVYFSKEVETPDTGVDKGWGSWLDVKVDSDMGISSVLIGASWNGTQFGTPNFTLGFNVNAPDGEKALSITQFKPFVMNTIALGTYINEKIVLDLENHLRELKVDVYIDDRGTTDFSLSNHGEVCFGMGNIAKFHNDKPQSGQDNGMNARITKINQWETLTFKLDPTNKYIRTKHDVDANEVDLLFLMVSPHFNNEGIPMSDAKYYFKELRVEKVN